MDNSIIAALIIIFIFMSYIPTGVLKLIDHPVLRMVLIISPFIAMNSSYLLSLLVVLVVGALFLERNARKLTAVPGAVSWWKTITGDNVPGPLDGTGLPYAAKSGPKTVMELEYLPENDSCYDEAPTVESGLPQRPMFETVLADANMRHEIDEVIAGAVF